MKLIYRAIEKREYFKEENKMKKLFAAVLCAAMVLSLGACGGSENTSAEATSDDNKLYVGTEAGFAPYE